MRPAAVDTMAGNISDCRFSIKRNRFRDDIGQIRFERLPPLPTDCPLPTKCPQLTNHWGRRGRREIGEQKTEDRGRKKEGRETMDGMDAVDGVDEMKKTTGCPAAALREIVEQSKVES